MPCRATPPRRDAERCCVRNTAAFILGGYCSIRALGCLTGAPNRGVHVGMEGAQAGAMSRAFSPRAWKRLRQRECRVWWGVLLGKTDDQSLT